MAYDHTRSDQEAAHVLGTSRGSFGQWRRDHGLPHKGTHGPLEDQEDRRRRKAYEATSGDVEAAEVLGISQQAFCHWRKTRHLPAKAPIGQPPRITPKQQSILDALRERPWQKEFELWKLLGTIGRFNVHDTLLRLENKGLVQRASSGTRALIWAPAGEVPLPRGAMALMPGAPSLYHAARLPARILEVLGKEPWLTIRMICQRLGPLGKPKAIDAAVRDLCTTGRIQRRQVETPARRFYAYALPEVHRLSAQRHEALIREVVDTYGWGEGDAKMSAVLSKRGPGNKLRWLTAEQIAEEAGIRPGYIYNCLKTARARGDVVRVRALEAGVTAGRGVIYRYALKEADPFAGPVAPESTGHGDALARMARIVRDNPGISSAAATEKYHALFKAGSYDTCSNLLRRLRDLGVVQSDTSPGARRQWIADGAVTEFMASRVRAHADLIERHVRKLRALGYEVAFSLKPPPLGGPR